MGSSAAVALSARNLSKHFGAVLALDDVSVDVTAGACLAIVGESGSGKSTLLKCFNRLAEPDRGEVFVDGVNVATLDPVALRRRIGYVAQDGGLLPHWRVLRNVALVPELLGLERADERAREALRLVGLEPRTFGARWPHELSGGQRQRVAIARALAAEPLVVLLDEPFGALDAITRSELQDTFGLLRARIGATSAIVTHDLHEALLLATDVMVMRRGRVEQLATPASLVASPATEYVRTLLERARVASFAEAVR